MAALKAARAFLFLHPCKGCDPRYEPFYLHNLLGSRMETALRPPTSRCPASSSAIRT